MRITIPKALFLLAFILSAAVSHAGSGSATLPFSTYYRSGSYFSATTVYLTNITENNIKVTITFYSKDGSVLSSSLVSFDNWINSNTELGAKTTGYALLNSATTGGPDYGKAVIEWENNSGDDDAVALIGYVVVSDVSSYGGLTKSDYQIKGGNPF